MKMVGLRLTPANAACNRPFNQAMVVDILWAAVRPTDRVEHIFVEPLSGLVHLVFFQRLDSFEEARDSVLELWQRASNGSHVLRDRFHVEVCSLDWT